MLSITYWGNSLFLISATASSTSAEYLAAYDDVKLCVWLLPAICTCKINVVFIIVPIW